MIYTTISCKDCKSDLGYGNAVASITIRDGVEYYINHTVGCGCVDLRVQCNRKYNPKEYEITKCKYCGGENLHTEHSYDD